MSTDWHETFARWAKPPSETEEDRASRAADLIRDAVHSSDALRKRSINVYATGSVRNNTNIRAESDVDVAVVSGAAFYYDIPDGTTPTQFGLGKKSELTIDTLRQEVRDALLAKFGRGVTAGKKAFNVKETSSRMEADVTPFLEYRKYKVDGSYDEGVKGFSTSNEGFVNWHSDHYIQGVAKNDKTGKRFKRIVRVLKSLKVAMSDRGDSAAKSATEGVPSFLIECLVFNAPDSKFNLESGSNYEDLRRVSRTMSSSGSKRRRSSTRRRRSTSSSALPRSLRPSFSRNSAASSKGSRRRALLQISAVVVVEVRAAAGPPRPRTSGFRRASHSSIRTRRR